MNPRLLVPALALLILAVAGCQNKEKQLVGTWVAGPSSELVLYENKTYTASQGPQTMEGTWSLQDKTVTIKAEKLAGKTKAEVEAVLAKIPPDKVAQGKRMIDATRALFDGTPMTLSDDGKSLTASFMGQSVTYRKKEQG